MMRVNHGEDGSSLIESEKKIQSQWNGKIQNIWTV